MRNVLSFHKKQGWKPGANTIAYYKFEGDANDYSGNGHNLTASGNVSYVTNSGASKEVVYLNGSSSSNSTGFVSADFSQQLTPSTFVMWYKAENNGGRNPLMAIFVQMYKSTNVYARTGVITARSSDNFAIRAYRDFVFKSGVQPGFGGGWHCVVGTVGEGNAKLYLDGEYKNGTTYTTADITDTTQINIGKNDDADFGYKGWISDTIIENRIRTAAEITNYYNQTKSNYESTLKTYEEIVAIGNCVDVVNELNQHPLEYLSSLKAEGHIYRTYSEIMYIDLLTNTSDSDRVRLKETSSSSRTFNIWYAEGDEEWTYGSPASIPA